ncbi:Myosin-2A [Hondaea fermentalgiana]|uniref:Myosin-2A n=1 Tax=Hondaea fermentalgiana TaxID=2315210 RepID=A0A2R5GCC6_9STRA|nr:Myosin-2A [Hondaea fermentalgiana]|eukprot:GBG28215.1 Myosin-2A [Hondaea fermentalgiana]
MTLVWIKSEGSVSWAPGISDVDGDGKECAHMLAANEGSPSSILVKSSPPALKKRAQGRPEILPRAPHDEAHEDDLTNLLYIHEASILHNLAARFKMGKPHSFISRVLLSVNPIQDVNEPLELAGRKEALDTPHPFSVAENAFQQLERQSTSQCIVISGESGSGKTETSKRVIRHLVMRTGEASTIDKRLLAASPILEAFGNAQTVSNGNSSRFGKFVNLYFTSNQVRFRNAAIETYLLERSRVVCYDENERSFHIFYELLAGASKDLRSDLHLEIYDGPLMAGIHSGRDDAEFVRLASSMKLFGMSAEIQKEVFAVVAAVLHLTCLRFVDKDSAEGNIASLSASCGPHLTAAASLLAVPQDDLLRLLCERAIVLRGETMVSQRTAAAASQARDALAKALYQRLFDWLVVQINRGLDVAQEPPGPLTSCESPSDLTCANFIGILDIFGFECFEKNSFEQLLINFANEALQTTFNEQVFQSELNLYKDEGLDTSGIASPPDDKCVDCLALFRTSHKAADRRPGLLAVLNTISVGPEPSDTKLIALLHRTFRGRPCFVDPHPRVAASTFIIEHYAGQVAYTINGFVSKNSDRLPPEADAFFLSQDSSSEVLAEMFAVSLQEGASNHASDGISPKPVKSKAKKSKKSIAATFEDQIRALMKVIRSTQCSFVRCIKPNPGLDPTKGFDHAFVARQLICLSIPQTAQLLQAGLPGRIAYSTLQRTFDPVLSAKLPVHLQPGKAPRGLGFERIVVKCILRSLGADADACKFGKTRVFFASGALAAIDGKLKAIERGEASVPEDLAEDIETACTLLAWQLKSSLFAYSASDNDSVNTACTDPELAAAWDARQLAGPDLEEDAFVSHFPTSNLPKRSAVDALIDDMLRNDTMGIVTQAIAEDEETLETCHNNDRAVHKDSLKNEEVSCGEDPVPCDAAQSQELHVSAAIEAEANAPRVLLSSQQMKPGAECEDAGYHADDDVRSLGDDEEEEEKVKDGTALEEEYGGDDDDDDEDDDDDDDVGEEGKEQAFQPIDSFETHPVQESTQDQKDGQDLDDNQDHVQHADEDLHQSRHDHDKEAEALCMASEELLRKEQDAHARRHSNEELTSMLMRLSPTAFTREDGGAASNMSTPTNARAAAGRTRSSRRLSLRSTAVKESCDGEMSFSGKVHGLQAQEGTFMQVVDDYAQTEKNASFSSKSSRDPRNRRSLRKFNFSAMFTLRKREERLVLRKLKAGMRKKHYRQVIEALVRARELELMAPDVLAAEQMIHRVKTLHAQQILREAMVLRNIESLIHAIDQAVRFGMEKDDPQGLLRDAREMLAKMQSRALARHNSTRSSKSDQHESNTMAVTGSSKAILASNGAVTVVGKIDGLQGDSRGARGGNGACGA